MNFEYRKNTDDDQYIIKEIVSNNMYKFEELKIYNTNPNAYIIDCGAHIGIFSKYASQFFPTLNYICFEPNIDNYSFLIKNMDSVANKTLYNKAVSYKDENIRLYRPLNQCKTGQCSFILYPYLNPSDYFDVPAINLNEIISKINDVFILKMDMEGYESIVLKNLDCLNKVKILILEEHDGCEIDHEQIKLSGFTLSFNPYKIKRHSVYIRK